MPAILLLVALFASLLAKCVPGGALSDGVPTADAPFTLTALDVGQGTLSFRCIRKVVCRAVPQRASPIPSFDRTRF